MQIIRIYNQNIGMLLGREKSAKMKKGKREETEGIELTILGKCRNPWKKNQCLGILVSFLFIYLGFMAYQPWLVI